MALVPDSAAGVLSINGVVLTCPAWVIPDLKPLWTYAGYRGEDRIIPHVDGVVPYARRPAPAMHDLPMLICGEVDRLGNPNGDLWAGLVTNVNYLRANVSDPVTSGTGTRSAVLAVPGAANRNAAVHVLGLAVGEGVCGIAQDGADGIVARAVLTISIPGGVFT